MPTKQSGFLVQGTSGEAGNFEVVVPSRFGGLIHVWRNNDDAALPWSGATSFGSGDVEAVSLIQSNFGTPGLGHLELVARVGSRLALYWRNDQAPVHWFGPNWLPVTAVAGNPALIQSSFGNVGHFELVVPLAGAGVGHLQRNNDQPGLPWSQVTEFGDTLGQVEAVAFLQIASGELLVAARVGGQLFLFERDAGPPFAWHGPTPIPLGTLSPSGTPALFQSTFGPGNLELVTPLSNGGIAHLGRLMAAPGKPWTAATTFGAGQFSAVSAIQSTFGTPGFGSFEVVARTGHDTAHFWRADTPPFIWSGPSAFLASEAPGNPASLGEWRTPFSTSVVGIHGALLQTGKVLFFTYEEHEEQQHGDSSVLDPVSGEEQHIHLHKNVFSAGHAFLPDGRLLVPGGVATGVKAVHVFTPGGAGGQWADFGDLPEARWYPTCTALPTGDIAIFSGTKNGGGPQINPADCTKLQEVNASYELFSHTTEQLLPPVAMPFFEEVALYSTYPFVYVLPDGRLFVHANHTSCLLDITTGVVTPQRFNGIHPAARTYNTQGTSVLLPLSPASAPPYRPKAMVFGGGTKLCPELSDGSTPATNSCEVIDLGAAAPAWQSAPAMVNPRVMPDAVLLPDGTVLVVNGSSHGIADNGVHPVFAAELYNPAANSWSTLAAMRVPRLYHSIALLLPDGRVLTAGKDEEFNPEPFHYPEYRIEIFSPPYLFKGPRPVITSAPAQVQYGSAFTVQTPDGLTITKAALIRPGAVTHSFNMEQRYVELELVSTSAGSVTLQAPPNATIMAPGFVMLFLLNGQGIPSIAPFVQLVA